MANSTMSGVYNRLKTAMIRAREEFRRDPTELNDLKSSSAFLNYHNAGRGKSEPNPAGTKLTKKADQKKLGLVTRGY